MIINQIGVGKSTKDANIIPNDVLKNKIAYGKDGKVVGTAPFSHQKISLENIVLPANVTGIYWYANGKHCVNVTGGIAISENGVDWTIIRSSIHPFYQVESYKAYDGTTRYVAITDPLVEPYYDDSYATWRDRKVYRIYESPDGINWSVLNDRFYTSGDSSVYVGIIVDPNSAGSADNTYDSVYFFYSSGTYYTTVYTLVNSEERSTKYLKQYYDGGATVSAHGKMFVRDESGFSGYSSYDSATSKFVKTTVTRNYDDNGILSSAYYGLNKYVGICEFSSGSNIIYSDSDGNVWNKATFSEDVSEVYSLTYGNGKFVATVRKASDQKVYFAYSLDGIDYTIAQAEANDGINLYFGNGRFFASSIGYSDVWFSEDGSDWALNSATVDVYYPDMETDIRMSTEGCEIKTLRAGKIKGMWTISPRAFPGTDQYTFVEYNGKILALPYGSSTVIYWSTDGLQWYSEDAGMTFPYNYTLACGNGRIVISYQVDDDSGSKRLYIASSTDGLTWNCTDHGTPYIGSYVIGPVFAGDKFIMSWGTGYYSGKRLLTSDDGIAWTVILSQGANYQLDFSSNCIGTPDIPGLIVAAGSADGTPSYSTDYGVTFTSGITDSELPAYNYYNTAVVKYMNGVFHRFVTNRDTGITVDYRYSYDGIHWVQGTPSDKLANTYTYGMNGEFVNVNAVSGYILFSDDGVQWREETLPMLTTSALSILYCGKSYIIFFSEYVDEYTWRHTVVIKDSYRGLYFE
jgi:hypothetical protein